MVWVLLPMGVFWVRMWLHSGVLCYVPGRGSPLARWLQGSFPEWEGPTTWWMGLSKTNRPCALSLLLRLKDWAAETNYGLIISGIKY